jgi:hypothetical protein
MTWRSAVERLGNSCELGGLQPFGSETVELLKAHDQRTPRVGVDAIPRRRLPSGTGLVAVVRAMRSTLSTIDADGRFSTHSPVRRRFCVVREVQARPSMQRCPSHQADDIGARFEVPSSFSLLINTTGVPKYRMVGSAIVCMA